jgi:hypothetical protein
MPTSKARINANRQNALRSTGPKTPEGKERSRANSYKHGLTGAGTVLPEREAAEVERRVVAFEEELQPSGEVGQALVRHAATMSVRMERCVLHETAAMTDRVRRAIVEFVPPEGVDAAEAARLRAEAGTRAVFDPSKEAILARRYEAAAVRGFFRALKELRELDRASKEADAEFEDEFAGESLGSISRMKDEDAEFDAMFLGEALPDPAKMTGPVRSDDFSTFGSRSDLPISIGRRR